MDNKLQNRLIGTVILIFIIVIISPKLSNCEKKYLYKKKQGEFISTPLILHPIYLNKKIPLVVESIPLKSLREVAIETENSNSGLLTANRYSSLNLKKNSVIKIINNPSVTSLHTELSQLKIKEPKLIEPIQLQSIKQSKLFEQNKLITQNKYLWQIEPTKLAYVIQLGALKNAIKVNEIVINLRRSGYYVWMNPSIPVQDQITRIYVGLDSSKSKIKEVIKELKKISGLIGIVQVNRIR